MRSNNIGGKLITSLICCAAWALHLPIARCATAQAYPWAATDVLVATDGKLADVYVNGHRLAKKEIVPVATNSGVTSSAKTTSCFYGPVAVGTSRGRMM